MFMLSLFLTALLTPDLGLAFWTLVAFLMFFFLLRKYAWKHILSGIYNREQMIEKSLHDSIQAQKSLQEAHSIYNNKIKEAEEEKQKILMKAESLRASIIEDAKLEAKLSAERITKQFEQDLKLRNDKMLSGLKEEIVELVLQTTEQVLHHKLNDRTKEREYVARLLSEISSPK